MRVEKPGRGQNLCCCPGRRGEDLGCTVTYLASSDLKGWLPSFVANQVATSQAAVLAAVAESLFTVADADDSLVL